MNKLLEMTRTEIFETICRLPEPKWTDTPVVDSLLIVPTGKTHDSGYGTMWIIGIKDGEMVYRMAGYSDILHFDGVGQYGDYPEEWKKTVDIKRSPKQGWRIDCLPMSGFLRILCNSEIKCENIYSSDFSFFGINKK